MANRLFTQFFKTLHKEPVLIDCKFTVDAANANGLGISALKGPGIKNVFMHTSAPLAGSGNPNPAAGTIIVQFQDTYFKSFASSASFRTPLSGTDLVVTSAGAALTVGVPYVITVLGTTTTAQWHTLGVPTGIIPAVGVPFIALATGVGAGTGMVQTAKSTGTGIDHIEALGDPNLTIVGQSSSSNSYAFSGSQPIPYLIFNTNLSLVKTQPADGTIITMQFLLSNSSLANQSE